MWYHAYAFINEQNDGIRMPENLQIKKLLIKENNVANDLCNSGASFFLRTTFRINFTRIEIRACQQIVQTSIPKTEGIWRKQHQPISNQSYRQCKSTSIFSKKYLPKPRNLLNDRSSQIFLHKSCKMLITSVLNLLKIGFNWSKPTTLYPAMIFDWDAENVLLIFLYALIPCSVGHLHHDQMNAK